ncbi:hypothetical protein ABW19_dt0200559 [Dactylella cylindrospora]|nr:hypothetical protein ABW19_dt0200559 [Dactylella cylindrospora]
MSHPALPNREYTIAWISALPVEKTAAEVVLDVLHDGPQEVHPDDHNAYQLGSIGNHNIVIACLPKGRYGTVNAAVTGTRIKLSFPSIRAYLMVGIGGGIPSAANDIRLGDVVVSKPEGDLPGVVQYDLGKEVAGGGFERLGVLDKPPPLLLNAVAALEATHKRQGSNIPNYLANAYSRYPQLGQDFFYQGPENDILYRPDYEYREGECACQKCYICIGRRILRLARQYVHPVIHYGIIASGNRVIKDGVTRDRIGNDTRALCFEMEAAGLMDHVPCLVIRGICDYSDSHKNKRWQPYAALTAAAYAKELIKQIPKATIGPPDLHCPRTRDRIFNFPRILHKNFSGRQKYLDRIHTCFKGNSPTGLGSIVSVYGYPGMGKTQICLKYAIDHENEYDYGFHTTASTPEQWLKSCDSIVQALRLPEASSSEQEKRMDVLRRWLSAQQGWIIVIDDVTPPTVSALRQTLPQKLGGNLLLCTRDISIAKEFSDQKSCIHLLEMKKSECRELVLKIYNAQEVAGLEELVAGINQELGGLPLALEQGIAYATSHYLGLGEYLESLKNNKRGMVRRTVRNPHHADTITTLDLALESLEPAHVAILDLILVMRPQALPHGILLDGASALSFEDVGDSPNQDQDNQSGDESAWDAEPPPRARGFQRSNWQREMRGNGSALEQTRLEIFNCITRLLESRFELNEAMTALESSSLIRRGEKGEIWVHDLFRELLWDRLEQWEREDFARYAGQIISRAFPFPEYETWSVCGSYLPYSIEVANILSEHNIHSADSCELMHRIGVYLWYMGRYDESKGWLERSLTGFEHVLGEDRLWTLAAVHSLGLVLSDQGEFDEALQCFQRVFDVYENVLSKDDERMANLTNNIAAALDKQGQYDEAMRWYGRSLADRQRILGDDHPDTLQTTHNIGMVLDQQGKPEALEWYMRAYVGYEKTIDQGNPHFLNTIHNIGAFHHDRGRYDEALTWLERALDGTERSLGKDHPDTLNTREALRRTREMMSAGTQLQPVLSDEESDILIPTSSHMRLPRK